MTPDMGARVREAVAKQIGQLEVMLIEARAAGSLLEEQNAALAARVAELEAAAQPL